MTLAAHPSSMDSAPGSIDTRNLLSVCRSGDTVDHGLLREMLGYFIDENQRRVTLSQQAVVVGDREMLRQVAHALRGSAALFGAGRLHDLAWSLEMDADQSDLKALARDVSKVRTELDSVVASLRRAHPEACA
jgi:HPt (histidine-containing phosphotransfer) domain-containing protein